MTKKPDGGPAFPFPSGPEPRVDQFHERWDGMTLRDYFAAAALQGLLAKHAGDILPMKFEVAASGAYHYADAMIAERAK